MRFIGQLDLLDVRKNSRGQTSRPGRVPAAWATSAGSSRSGPSSRRPGRTVGSTTCWRRTALSWSPIRSGSGPWSSARSKTDKLDSLLLANLLRIDQVPLFYVPPEGYQRLREITRFRARLTRGQAEVKAGLQALLARHNRVATYRVPFGLRGVRWFQAQAFGPVDNDVRDELLGRLAHYRKQVAGVDAKLEGLRTEFPQVEALLDLRGIGLYSALVIVAELGEVGRFRSAHQVSAYSGLTAQVRQSGSRCRHGSISREGSPWLRWILTQAAMQVVKEDKRLRNFYDRVRKRSNTKVARVAVARKLAEICWKRLRRWHLENAGAAA